MTNHSSSCGALTTQRREERRSSAEFEDPDTEDFRLFFLTYQPFVIFLHFTDIPTDPGDD
jgi:hypothetical protein